VALALIWIALLDTVWPITWWPLGLTPLRRGDDGIARRHSRP